tara:strand:+ start:590 stop:766 length:177 start_codon:yes stop_codon:yes gene_type:complete
MKKEITTEWTLKEVSTIRMAIADKIFVEEAKDKSCPDRMKRLENAKAKIQKLHRKMIW